MQVFFSNASLIFFLLFLFLMFIRVWLFMGSLFLIQPWGCFECQPGVPQRQHLVGSSHFEFLWHSLWWWQYRSVNVQPGVLVTQMINSQSEAHRPLPIGLLCLFFCLLPLCCLNRKWGTTFMLWSNWLLFSFFLKLIHLLKWLYIVQYCTWVLEVQYN